MKPSLDFPLVGHCVGLAAVLAIVAVTSAADPHQTVVLGDSLAAGAAPPTPAAESADRSPAGWPGDHRSDSRHDV
jgi:hypothetical protein